MWEERTAVGSTFVPAWPATLVKSQIVVAYVFGGSAKLNFAYPTGAPDTGRAL